MKFDGFELNHLPELFKWCIFISREKKKGVFLFIQFKNNANSQVVDSSETEESRSNKIMTFTSPLPSSGNSTPLYPVLSYNKIVWSFEWKILCLWI